MTRYAKRKLKYSLNENFNLLPYVEWDRFATLARSKSGLRVTLSYLDVVLLMFLFFFFFLITDCIALIAVNNLLDIQLLPSISDGNR